MILFRRLLISLVIVGFISLIAAQIASTFLLRSFLERKIGGVLAVPVHIERAGANVFRASLWMRGVRIENPAGFKERDFIWARTISIDLSLLSFLTSKLVVPRVLLKDPHIILEVNEAGDQNLSIFIDRIIERFKKFTRKKFRLINLITQYTIEKFAIRNGDIDYIDNAQNKNWKFKSVSFSLARLIHPLDPQETLPTAIYMNATVPGSPEGKILILGRLNPFAKKKSFDITGSAKNLVFNQYSGFVPELPLHFQEGTLQLKVKAVCHEDQVDIHNQVKIEKLKFKLDKKMQKESPLIFGISAETLAKFFNEVQSPAKPFEFEFEVFGDLSNPNFNVFKEMEQSVRKVVSGRVQTEMMSIDAKTKVLPKVRS